MKKVFIPLGIVALMVSCEGSETLGAQEQKGEITSSVDASEELPADLRKEMEAEQKKADKIQKKLEATWTTLKFDKLVHDFGKVKADTDVITQFRVTNTGNKPLIIENVAASCGCTMPKKPEAPIAPGASDVIEVKFHSKPGQLNEITKSITVTANTKEKAHMVEIKAFVIE